MEIIKQQRLTLILRVLMGSWFLYTGGLKIFASGLDRFGESIANYQLLDRDWSNLAAHLVAWLEVVAGICFMLGILSKGAWFVMLGLVGAFTLSVGSAWWRGLDISCGCLGGDRKISYWAKFLEFGVYHLILSFLAWSFWKPANSLKSSDQVDTSALL